MHVITVLPVDIRNSLEGIILIFFPHEFYEVLVLK
jgi:hypothetical protein